MKIMKKQHFKINKDEFVTRVIIFIFLITSTVGLFGCYFGPTISYEWNVQTHVEFVEEIEKFNSLNDGVVNAFISFDLDNCEDISEKYYQFSAVANKGAVNKYGLCDKFSHGPLYIDLVYYLKSNVENDEHNEHAYKIHCSYGDVQYNFSEDDKIEIQNNMTHNCGDVHEDHYYGMRTSKNMIYNNVYLYEFFVNDVRFACIHISSIGEASEETLGEIIQMLLDSIVILNTEE